MCLQHVGSIKAALRAAAAFGLGRGVWTFVVLAVWSYGRMSLLAMRTEDREVRRCHQ
jgi:hypothetical protein